MDFIDAEEADFGILRCLDKADKLRYRGIEHADDELHGYHDAEGDFTVDDGNGAIERDCHILDTVDELRSDGLGGIDFQYFLIDMEQACLQGFPFPAFGVFVIVQFDFLDVFNGFYLLALVFGRMFEILPVDFLAHIEEKENPTDIEDAAGNENEENDFMVNAEDDAEYDECYHGKCHAEGIVHDEGADAFMVSGALQEVPDEFVFEEGDGQFHEFDEVVGEQGDVHSCSGMEEHPFTEHVGKHDADEQDGVGNQHHVDERDVAGLYAGVNDSLGDEGQQGLQEGGYQHDGKQNAECLFVREEITEQVLEGFLAFFFLPYFNLHEICHGFEEKRRSGFLVCLVPFADKFFV